VKFLKRGLGPRTLKPGEKGLSLNTLYMSESNAEELREHLIIAVADPHAKNIDLVWPNAWIKLTKAEALELIANIEEVA
jgi:hypothetical protein